MIMSVILNNVQTGKIIPKLKLKLMQNFLEA
jgi:hypothetical protein